MQEEHPLIKIDKKHTFRFLSLHLLLLVVVPSFSFAHNLLDVSPFTITLVDGETGEPLIGATAINLTTNPDRSKGTISDLDGKLVLNDLGHRDLLEFSYVGYTTLRIPFFEVRSNKGMVKLYPAIESLGTVVVIGRKDQPVEEIPYIVERIDRAEIAFSNAQTAADILSMNAGVYVQKSQMGGGSPIIRGFEANRVLLVIDGVRMNNAIYRNGHLQNSITVDNAILERAEVIYGPGSLMYGSDALGGVVHYRTRDPKLFFGDAKSDFRFDTNMYTRFSTANREKAVHLDLDYGTKNWGSLTSFTYSNYGDLVAGSKRPEGYSNYGTRQFYIFRNENVDEVRTGDFNEQTGTAYSQIDFLQKVKYQPNDRLYFVLNLQYSNSSNVPRYDNLLDTLESASQLKWAEWYYGPQQRMFSSLKMQATNPTTLYDKFSLIAGFQRIDEDRLKRKFRNSHRTFNLEDVYVYSLTGDFDKYLDKNQRNKFSYGFEGSYNDVSSSAGRMNINSGNVIYDELTRYPSGGSDMRTVAGYMNYNWRSRDTTFNFNIGARYTDVQTAFTYHPSDSALIDWPSNYYEGLVNRNNAMTWAAGFTWNSRDNWQIRAVTSTAFRSPNLDDLAKIRAKSSKVTVPNLDLKPEYSLNYEATLGKQFGRVVGNSGAFFKLSATAFYTELTDVIVREEGILPNGDEIIIVDRDLYDVQQNFNAGEAFIYGLSGNTMLNVADRFILKAGVNYTKGRRLYKENEEGIVIDTLVPLDHVPPMYGQGSIAYRGERFRIEGVVRYNAAKGIDEYGVGGIDIDTDCGYEIDREGLADNIEFGLIDRETQACGSIYQGLPSWMTYSIYSSYQLTPSFSINLAVENITDIHYKHFGSAISAPGRNFILTLRGSF